ncbi:MAG: magnesium-translocating P-type ATPase [Oscillospiraceae bacterium]|nr:magnesium-translocating P-type ATPase [Oscillospiraceae bacterium]
MIRFKFETRAKKQIQENRRQSEELIREDAALVIDELYAKLASRPSGLTEEESDEALSEYGANKITAGKHDTVWRRLREATINPFNIVLLAVAATTYMTDVVFSKKPEYITFSITLFLVLLSSAIAFVQGQRGSHAAAQLADMIINKADVIRGGKQIEIDIDDIVPGDVLRLSSGDMIPADVRFLSAKDLFIAQAALTGESSPVEKFAEGANGAAKHVGLTDLRNIGFMGSNVVSGTATAIVLATGNETYFGSMAKSLSGDSAKNSFERGVDSISRLLLRMMLVMVPVVFLINGLMKGDWLSALLFAIAVAVGLMPEMLPVIMTSTLAKGAVAMSGKKVIVKALGAIQTFGEMDILCTDKTGTLTEDKVILEKYMNIHGEDDARILRHAYLNSYFQTGLKNLIDLAVINRAEKNGLSDLLANYTRMDEIPFDFARRRMSVVLKDMKGKRQLITKGAVEEMLSVCSMVEMNGKVIPLTEDERKYAMATYEKHNGDGLRMIAVAQKNEVPEAGAFSVADESEMVLLGFVGFLDPPKESAGQAIEALRKHGVRTVVLTGDSEGVAAKVCRKVGLDVDHMLTGRDVEQMSDGELSEAIKTCDLFSKLSPTQKERVVKAFQAAGHTVGYMGDGINDAPPLHAADVGISVDTAVDIAKETADIILLKKDLMVLEDGIIEGRRTFGNIIKYIKMAASGNFGNMFSVLAASLFLPFLPMLPVQILAQNLLCDISQIGIPFDSVDKEYLTKPRRWDTQSVQRFMFAMGPLSSLFDIMCYLVLWFVFKANNIEFAPLFQCGWFVFGTISQILVIHIIRTSKTPFVGSRPSVPLLVSSISIAAITAVIAFTGLGRGLDMAVMPGTFAIWLVGLLAAYMFAAQFAKRIYINRYSEWI